MNYSLITLWHERRRFIPAVLAVAFSALLVVLQSGLVVGALYMVSLPVDRSRADLWIGAPQVASVDMGTSIPERWGSRLGLRAIDRFESFVHGFGYWRRPTGGSQFCMVVGSRLHDSALGAVAELTPELRARLAEPGSVVVDASDFTRLGLRRGVGETAEINGHRAKVVGLVHGLKGLGGTFVFCSIDTARRFLNMSPGQATYLLARCRPGEDPSEAVEGLRSYKDMSVYTAAGFSYETRSHWLLHTGAGVLLGISAALGLLVGAVITSQTLYAATVASLREFAVLRALGIPGWRVGATVLIQSFWTGVAGILVSIPIIYLLARLAETLGGHVYLSSEMLVASGIGTLLTAVVAGIAALRSLRLMEPAVLLR